MSKLQTPGGVSKGDPHIQAFDGRTYACQGRGEFLLTAAATTDTEVQARFEGSRGISLTTGVVAREGDSSVVQVTRELSGWFVILVDGEPYNDVADDATGVVLTATGARVEMRFSSGLDVFVTTLTPVGGHLAVTVWAPVSLATTGLLGNNNGDSTDDWQVSVAHRRLA